MTNDISKNEESIDVIYSDNLLFILEKLNLSLIATSYQANAAIIINANEHEVAVEKVIFPRPMGLCQHQNDLYLGTHSQILCYKRYNKNNETHFYPRNSHVTGNINVHDIAMGNEGLWLTNSSFSCLCLNDEHYSFIPRWKPPFISELKPQDRCHLNGMAMQNGKPAYVSTFSQDDQDKKWREKTSLETGTIIDITTNEVIVDKLCMPHSPRIYQDNLFFCESALGRLWRYNLNSKKLDMLLELPAFIRGIDIFNNLMFLGMSTVRESSINHKIPLKDKYDKTYCGIQVIDLDDMQELANIHFENSIEQIYDVLVVSDTSQTILHHWTDEAMESIYDFPETLTPLSK